MSSKLTSFLTTERRRWMALIVVCLAQLMIVLDTTIVNVALPVIQRDLHFTQGNLTWVINAFMITFGSLLLLAGRMSDLLGRRRLFLAGVILFTISSLLCGFAPSQGLLIAARGLQGVGAAMQASVILAIIVTEFPQPRERAKAMSAYVFTAVAGGSLGLLAGGVLTEALSWHWIFFVNVPIGIGTVMLGRLLIPKDQGLGLGAGVDYVGSLLVTSSLMLAVYAIVSATSHGWGSWQVLGFGAISAVLMAAFIAVESRVANPIMPLRILRLRNLVGAGVVRGLLVTGMFGIFFLGTLYLEHVLHYSAIQTGLAYLPWTLTVAALSLGGTAWLMRRFGPLRLLTSGLAISAAGMLLLAHANATTSFFPTIFFAFVLIGLGIGNAFTPLMTMAMGEVPPADAGLGSGITTLSQQVGGALGLAVLGTIATNHAKSLAAHGASAASALVGGDQLAFVIAAGCVIVAIGLAFAILRERQSVTETEVDLPELALELGTAEAGELVVSADPVIRRRFVLPVRVAHVDQDGHDRVAA